MFIRTSGHWRDSGITVFIGFIPVIINKSHKSVLPMKLPPDMPKRRGCFQLCRMSDRTLSRIHESALAGSLIAMARHTNSLGSKHRDQTEYTQAGFRCRTCRGFRSVRGGAAVGGGQANGSFFTRKDTQGRPTSRISVATVLFICWCWCKGFSREKTLEVLDSIL